MVSFRFKRPCMPPVVITQRRLTLPARSDRSGAAFRNRWGTVSKEVGHRYDREPKSAPLPVETAPHFVRNCAPLPVGISAPFRPESADHCADGRRDSVRLPVTSGHIDGAWQAHTGPNLS